MEDERIHGLTLRECAEIMSKDGELKAQHGEPSYKSYFQQYLAQRGTDENTWAHAWNGWWTRMESDPSGQLHAKFATMQQQLTQQAHFADVPDASQDAKEGVTLEKYAEVMARAAGGEDMQALVSEAGFEWAQWQKAQAAWNQAMSEDVNHHLTTQYGQLYAKYTPGFQQQMEGQTAAIMAARHAEQAAGIPDEPDEDYTLDDMIRDMEDANPHKRWDAAHLAANEWDIASDRGGKIDSAGRRAVALSIECLERYDDHSVSNAEAAAKDLAMFASQGFLTQEQADDAKGDIERALGRGRESLARHQAAFEPIKDKAVPERVKMQSAIQDYTSLVEELSEVVEEWDDNFEAPSAGGSAGGGSSDGGGTTDIAPAGGGGFLDMLKKLPIIGPLLKALGL